MKPKNLIDLFDRVRREHPSDADQLTVIDGSADSTTAARVRGHLKQCEECRNSYELLEEIHSSLVAHISGNLDQTGGKIVKFAPAATPDPSPLVSPAAGGGKGKAPGERMTEAAFKEVSVQLKKWAAHSQRPTRTLAKSADRLVWVQKVQHGFEVHVLESATEWADRRAVLHFGELTDEALFHPSPDNKALAHARFFFPRMPPPDDYPFALVRA